MAYSHMQPDMYSRMEKMRRAEMRRYAAQWRLLDQPRGKRSWLARSRCWLLGCLGRWLVEAGKQLQRYGYHEGRAVEA